MGSFEIEVGKTRRIFCSEEILQIIGDLLSKLIIDNERNRMITTVSYFGLSSYFMLFSTPKITRIQSAYK